MAEVLKKFGRYFLLDHIAQGGMAEIYRARLASADGARRIIVIKRIQAGFGANEEFLQMFRSEINVMMGFNHPNIVQLYDFGEEQNQPYIAMEFVDGRNLRQFISRSNEKKEPFPVELAVYIIEQAAAGLHYAHAFKDKITGQHLNLVHRDISPQNVLISYDGNIKVIDFGIAKATINSEATRAGVIKGKPSYLSPEQISGDPLDSRSDIFALGIVLWELLAGKKLFAGENDLAILKLIESCQTYVKPPSTVNPRVPKELDYIVLRSLAKQREKRFQTGEEMSRALHKFLYSFAGDFNPADLSYFAKDLFKEEIVEDRKRIQKLNEKVEQLLAFETVETAAAERTEDPEDKEEETTTVANVRGVQSSGSREAFEADDLEMEGFEIESPPPGVPQPRVVPTRPAPVQQQPSTSTPSPHSPSQGPVTAGATPRVPLQRPTPVSPPQQKLPPRPQKKPGGLPMPLVAGVAMLVAAALFGPQLGIKLPFFDGEPEQAEVVLIGNQKDVTITVDGKPVGTGLPITLKAPAATSFKVGVLTKDNVRIYDQEFVMKAGEHKTVAVRGLASTQPPVTQAAPPPPKSILLRLSLSPGGGLPTILVNGKPVDSGNPVIYVPLDAPIEIKADRAGFRPFHRETVVPSQQAGSLREWMMDIPLEPLRFGYLTVHSVPSADATIMMDGQPWMKKTPLEREKMPIGTYNIKLRNEVLGMGKVLTVKIEEGKIVNLDEHLEIMNKE